MAMVSLLEPFFGNCHLKVLLFKHLRLELMAIEFMLYTMMPMDEDTSQ